MLDSHFTSIKILCAPTVRRLFCILEFVETRGRLLSDLEYFFAQVVVTFASESLIKHHLFLELFMLFKRPP